MDPSRSVPVPLLGITPNITALTPGVFPQQLLPPISATSRFLLYLRTPHGFALTGPRKHLLVRTLPFLSKRPGRTLTATQLRNVIPPLRSAKETAPLLTIPTVAILLQPEVTLDLPLGLTTVPTANLILLVANPLLLR